MLERAVRFALQRGLRQGLLGGSRVWMGLGTAAVAVRVLQRLGRSRTESVCEQLHPGETLVITNIAEPS